MKTQTKAIVASVVVIALCLSAVSGITYSWFSDTEETGIAITTGSIELDASVNKVSVKSHGDADWKMAEEKDINGTVTKFVETTLGGKATVTENADTAESTISITFENMAPGDSLKLSIGDVMLKNTIKVRYYEEYSATSSSGGTDPPFEITGNSRATVTDLSETNRKIIDKHDITITLPNTASEGMGVEWNIVVKLVAIQINASETEATAKDITSGGTITIDDPDCSLILGGNSNLSSGTTTIDMCDSTQYIRDSIVASNGQSLTMKNGELLKDDTFGKIRFDTKGQTQSGTFENMTFTDILPPGYKGNSSTDAEEMIQICPNANGTGTYTFRNCTFNNAYVSVNGMNNGANVTLTFENCTFNNTGNASAININSNYASGSVTVKNCTFNLITTSNIEAVDVAGTKDFTISFEGSNTVNGSIADSSIYNLFNSQSVKAYTVGTGTNQGNHSVTGAETISVTGIATKDSSSSP